MISRGVIAGCAWRFWCLLLISAAQVQASGPTYPVVIVPGIAASVLDGKLNRSSAAEWYCTRTSDWRVIYFSFRVQIRAHDFGGLEGITALDPADPKLTATYKPLIRALEAVGYRERVTLWGAPYDWRFAADGLAGQGVADAMQALIEMAVSTAGGKPAVIVAHSMGNLVLAYFLKLWGPTWARKHIHHVVAASGPWGGAVKSIKGTVSGDNFGLPIPHNFLHSLQGIAPSGPWLFPAQDVWPPDAVILRTNVKHYTASDLGDLLQVHSGTYFNIPGSREEVLLVEGSCKDIGSRELATAWPRLQHTHSGQLKEGTVPVPLLCAYGNGLDTDESYIYDVSNLNQTTAPEPYNVQSKEGDGTVNARSLRACAKVGLENQTTVLELPLESHLGVLSARPFLHHLAKILHMPGIDLVRGAQLGEQERLEGAPDAGMLQMMFDESSVVHVTEG